MKRRKKKSNSIKKYNRLNIISSIIWILAGVGVFAFGIYYKENFEKIFGAVAVVFGFLSLHGRRKPLAIKRYEENRLALLLLGLVIYSLVNPIGNIAIIFDLFKRDFVIRGGIDDKI